MTGPSEGRNHLTRLGGIYRDVAMIGLGTAVLLLIFELLAGAAIWVLNLDSRTVAQLPYYRSQDWGEQYWEEHRLLEIVGARRYEPFALWRFRVLRGETMNVGEDGIRRTTGAQCEGEAPTLLVFGGSTTWGYAAPDWETIPAHLLDELRDRLGAPVCVVNMAQGGHVSTQELIELIRLLESGERPDYVIFYDGINDTVAAAESGQAGVHQSLEPIRRRFELTDPPILRQIEQSNLGELAERARMRFAGPVPYPDGFDLEELSEEVVAHYLAHAEMVQVLARAYGFEAWLFWQPVIAIGDKPLTSRERQLRTRMDPSLVELYTRTYPAMERAARDTDRLFYIADVLDSLEGDVYVDPHHVTPVANRAVAHRIAELAWGPNPGSPRRGPGAAP